MDGSWREHCARALVLVGQLPIGAPNGAASAVPDRLQASAEHRAQRALFARGVQVYACAARPHDPAEVGWTSQAPRADLWDEDGERVGSHDAGPSWAANDGSTVVGQVVERADAPDPSAIPWLLLKAQANGGAGAFGTVTYIQRLDTVGGIAPSDVCDRQLAGAVREVAYAATYVFYGLPGAGTAGG